MPTNVHGLEYIPFEQAIIPSSTATYSELAGVSLRDWYRSNYGDLANEMELPPYWLEKYMQPGVFDYLRNLAQGTAAYLDRPEGIDVTLGQVLDYTFGLPSGEKPPLPDVPVLPESQIKHAMESGIPVDWIQWGGNTEGWYTEVPGDWGLPVIAGEQPTQEIVKGVTNKMDQPWMYSDVDYDIAPQPSGFSLPNMGDWWQQNIVSPWSQFIGSGGAVQLPPNTQVGYAPAIGGIAGMRALIPAAKSAALAVSVPRSAGGVVKAGITAGAAVSLIARFGKPVMRAILGGLAVKEALDLVAGGGEGILINWNPFRKAEIKSRRRYSFTVASSPHTIAKAAKAMKKVLRKHNKAIGSFLPKKVTYGIPPASALSTVEKRAIRRRK